MNVLPVYENSPEPTNHVATDNSSPMKSVYAIQEIVTHLHKEQQNVNDLLSSLGFALRSFNNLNQFLELIPLMSCRVTDAEPTNHVATDNSSPMKSVYALSLIHI